MPNENEEHQNTNMPTENEKQIQVMYHHVEVNAKMEQALIDLYDGFCEANRLPNVTAEILMEDYKTTTKPQREFLREFCAMWEWVY